MITFSMVLHVFLTKMPKKDSALSATKSLETIHSVQVNCQIIC